MTTYGGIDPGLSGASALIHSDGALTLFDTLTIEARKGREYVPATMAEVFRGCGSDIRVALESGIAMPRQNAASTYKQGRGVGLWEGVLSALAIPYELVAPSRWKKELGLPAGSSKGESRALAARLFPASADCFARVRDDGRAEAALLAEWSRRRG